jgi:hypothetical protein
MDLCNHSSARSVQIMLMSDLQVAAGGALVDVRASAKLSGHYNIAIVDQRYTTSSLV